MRHLFHLKKGFTLIELLVVMSIMAVLVGVGMYGYQTSISRSRDQRRKADLALVQGALENYKANDPNSSYPPASVSGSAYAGLANYLVPNYLPSLPNDPLYNPNSPDDLRPNYSYSPNCATINNTSVCKTYSLSAALENGGASYVIDQTGQVNPQPTPTQQQCVPTGGTCSVASDCCSNSCTKNVCDSSGSNGL